MIALPTHGRVYLACGSTDMRRGFDGLAVMVQEVLMQESAFGRTVRVQGQARRSDQAVVVGWSGSVFVRQASGKRTLHLADGGDGNRISVGGATGDAA